MQYAFYFDGTKCTGCKTCQVACKETYHLPVNNLYRRVFNYVGGSWEMDPDTGFYQPNGVFGYFVSMACNHCSDPVCVSNCPVGAMQKDSENGIVWVNQETCIGCKTCIAVCPYGAPTFRDDLGVTGKCDMCRDDVLEGDRPLCVKACPMRALDWGPRDELVAKYGEGNVEIEPLPTNTTGASTIINPSPSAQPSGEGTGYEASLAEEL